MSTSDVTVPELNRFDSPPLGPALVRCWSSLRVRRGYRRGCTVEHYGEALGFNREAALAAAGEGYTLKKVVVAA